jgi:glycine cleavage system transcriptional repressor
MGKDYLILTAIGPDQIGLVQKISAFISGHGCNIEDSNMAVLHGEFAVIFLFTGDRERFEKIADDSQKLESETGLSIAVKIPPTRSLAAGYRRYRLTASCMDHPGVVYQLSAVLGGLGINIESMETKTYPAPVSGTPLFQLDAQIAVPPNVDYHELRKRFKEIQERENIDVETWEA